MRAKVGLVVVLYCVLVLAIIALYVAPRPTPKPASTATPVLIPSLVPTRAPIPIQTLSTDPDHPVWAWRFSGKYGPESKQIPLIGRAIFEGQDKPMAVCSANIYLGRDTYPLVSESCRTSEVVRIPLSEVETRFPTVWGVYSENP